MKTANNISNSVKPATNELYDLKRKYFELLSLYKQTVKNNNIPADVIETRHSILNRFSELYADAKRGLQYKEEGAQVLYKKMKKIFAELGVVILDKEWFKKNPKFNESVAEAVAVQYTMFNIYDNSVVEVIEDGFKDKYGIIKYAKVTVAKYGI